MSRKIFINNLDTYVSRAVFDELRNDDVDPESGEANPDANVVYGSYITKDSSEKPQGVKKMLKVSNSILLWNFKLSVTFYFFSVQNLFSRPNIFQSVTLLSMICILETLKMLLWLSKVS